MKQFFELKKLLILLFLFIISCQQPNSKKLPGNLEEAIGYFEKKWTNNEKNNFIKDSLKNSHFTIGMWIRNNWIYGGRDTILVNFFHKIEIYHPDDISSIILTSLYRKLTNKPINLEEQVADYKAYWKPIIECEKRERKLAWENYQKLKIGDHLMVYFQTDEDGFAVGRNCEEWTFDPGKDFKLKGVVTEKYHINDTANVFIKVKILEMNRDSIYGMVNAKKKGEIEDFSLRALKFEIIK